MRADMPKVIVERPRYGHAMRGPGKGYQRATRRIAWDEQPRRERLRQVVSGQRKHFSERLGPLVRLLQQRVGRLWSDVESEICAHLRRDNVIQDHVRDHLAEMVVTQVTLEKGRPCHASGWRIGQPIRAGGSWFARFYVCPRTAKLKESPRVSKKQRLATGKGRHAPLRLLPYDYNRVWLLREGVWLLATFEPIRARDLTALPLAQPSFPDAHLGRPITRPEAIHLYGRAIHITDLRLATRGEIQRYCK